MSLGSTRRMKCGIFCTEEQHDFVAGAAYVAGADGHYGVAGAGFAEQEFDAVLHGAEIVDVFVAGLADGGGQGFAGYAGNGLLAGGVDVGEDENVGEIEREGEFAPEMLGARIAMRLEKY